jgi:opacity protein-like surface antigen
MYNRKNFLTKLLLSLVSIVCMDSAIAQVGNWQETHRGAVYFSAGYEKEWFTKTNIHVNEGPANTYVMNSVTGTDLGISNDPSRIKHYNFKLGYLVNYAQNVGLELDYDPFRYYIPDNQNVQISGAIDGAHLTETMLFSRRSGYIYDLRDGGGVMTLNFVKRFGIYRKISHKFSLDVLVKGGMGLVMPTVDYGIGNSLNKPSAGTNSATSGLAYGVEGGCRWTTQRHFFLEFDYKYRIYKLDNMNIPAGNISQDMKGQSVTLSLGYIFAVTKYNPMFSKGWPHRKEITHPKPMYHTEEDY